MTNFRALCAELLQELEHASDWDYRQALKDQARAALAQPETEEPTDEELTRIWNHVATNRRQQMAWFEVDCLSQTDYQQFARSVLRQWGRFPPVIEPRRKAQ